MAISELQFALIGLGVAIVGGVVGYNAWQARRHRRLAEGLVKPQAEDILLDAVTADIGEADARPAPVPPPSEGRSEREVRREPTLDDVAQAQAEPPVEELPSPRFAAASPLPATAGQPESVVEIDAFPGSAMPATQPAADSSGDGETADDQAFPLPPQLLSPAADYIAAFESVEAVAGDQILQSQGELLRSIGKRVAWVGFDDALPGWEFCRSGATYRRLRIGVQLADRQGPLSDSGFDHFYRAMQNFADEITAVADLPPRRAALESAQRLDRICAGVDIQVGVNVVSKDSSFAGTKVRALAEAAGMVIEADGSYARRDDDGRLLYTLHLHDGAGFSAETIRSLSANGLTFLLDVPRVANGDRVFNQMLEVARRFAETLHGQLVDDNRRPITEAFLTPIRKQIGQYQATMAAHGLPAGSDVALRLFS